MKYFPKSYNFKLTKTISYVVPKIVILFQISSKIFISEGVYVIQNFQV